MGKRDNIDKSKEHYFTMDISPTPDQIFQFRVMVKKKKSISNHVGIYYNAAHRIRKIYCIYSTKLKKDQTFKRILT